MSLCGILFYPQLWAHASAAQGKADKPLKQAKAGLDMHSEFFWESGEFNINCPLSRNATQVYSEHKLSKYGNISKIILKVKVDKIKKQVK